MVSVTNSIGIENVLIILGESFWVFSLAAQLRRLVRTRNTHGLSALSQTLNAAGNVAWTTYFATQHLWYPFATNIIMIPMAIALLGFTLSDRRQFGKGLLAIAVIGPLTSYILILHPDAGGWVGMSYNWIAGTPFLYRIVKRKKVSGLSEKSIFFALGAMACTLAYALIIHALPLIVGCIQAFVYELTVTRYYYRYRRH